MTAASLPDASRLLSAFFAEDEYYLSSSEAYGHGGEAALDAALQLFLARPELGFVWMAKDGEEPVAVCVVSFAVSTSAGGLVAKLDDVFVRPERQRTGVGSTLLAQLKEELRRQHMRRMDTSVHLRNDVARAFYAKNGFVALNEERLACLIEPSRV